MPPTMSRSVMPILRQSSCATRFVAFGHEHDFKVGMIVRERAGYSLLSKSGNGSVIILGLCDPEPLFDAEALIATAGYRIRLGMFVGKVDQDGDRISLWVDRRCLEPMPEEVLRWR
jgi:hypothetical protein